LEEISAQLRNQIETVPGAWFQKLMFLDFWNRQRLFIFYQPMMYDYWRGVATPYMNQEYARFCLSLPRLALEDRRLEKEMMRKYYPRLAEIPGTYGSLPIKLSKRYLFKRGIASLLPKVLLFGPLREFNPVPNTLEADCVRAKGTSALWPICEARERLDNWFRTEKIDAMRRAALAGDASAHMKHFPIQTIAFRLL